MKTLVNILLFPPSAGEKYRKPHQIWLGIGVTGMGICIGVLTLLLTATSLPDRVGGSIFLSYFKHPLLLFLNLLPAVLLAWLFYLCSGRAWAGFLGSGLPCVGLGLVNYYKIRLRGDPLLGADLLLIGEAKGIVGRYTLELTRVVLLCLVCLALGLLASVFLMPRGVKSRKVRLWGVLACAALLVGTVPTVYYSGKVYQKTANTSQINPWSDREVFISRGVVYSFLHSVQDIIPEPPEGYDAGEARKLLESCSDQNIPQEQKVDVVGIMLEAFCDLSDFPALGELEGVQQVYEPLHQLEQESVSGDLLTNIFAGGTVNSEWCFLTGYSRYDQFRGNTDSYVWYFQDQGYETVYHHPGYGWFYNRQNVCPVLGFQESYFTENGFGGLVDPTYAVYRSDGVLVDWLLEELERAEEPLFTFSVTYQNHGPYGSESSEREIVSPDQTGWSRESCRILDNYLAGVADSIDQLCRLVRELEGRETPTVLVFFGDHKPWLGNGDSVYYEIGADFDFSTLEGFAAYYGTPYLIWANSAAKEALGRSFTGSGRDISPCFLMAELFDQCGWEGPGFMQLSRRMRAVTPLLHDRELFLPETGLTDQLGREEQEEYSAYLGAEYYRRTQMRPKG